MAKRRYRDKHKEKLKEDMPQVPVYEHLLPPKRTKTPYEAKLMTILLEPTDFKKKFLGLKIVEQLAMNQLLAETYDYGKNNQLSGFAKDFAEGAGYLIDNIFELAGTEYTSGVFETIHRDEKRLIRMECHGSISMRKPHQLSVFYKFFNKKENKGKWNLRAYDMKKSPMWRVFMQFESFRKIMPDIRRYLQKKGINPDALKVMTVSDFCDVIFNAYKTSTRDTKVSFLPEGESIKAKYVKEFMRRCGNEYKQMKLAEGYRIEAVESLCNAMRLWGITEPAKVTVTALTYSPEIIENLSKAGYKVKDIEIGSKIPQEFTDYLIMHHQEKLIQAKDENGRLITTEGMEGDELHHNGAVAFAANNGYLARTNYDDMLVLINTRMHKFVHYYDRILKHNGEEELFSRLMIKNKKVRAILGFSKSKQIEADFADRAESQKREAEDKKYVVNYNKMADERLKNEIEIAQKYAINYTKEAITQKLEEIKSVKWQDVADAAEIGDSHAGYVKWLKKQKKSRRQKKEERRKEQQKDKNYKQKKHRLSDAELMQIAVERMKKGMRRR